jgi:geranylgeranyl pyrophosphate synthase
MSLSTDFLKHVRSEVQGVNYRLDTEVPVPEINTLLNKTVVAGGKRIRPLLTYLMGGLFGVSRKELAPFARAVELTHASFLAHDDVIDDAKKRRGKATINALSTNTRAVLAGDSLVSRVLVEMVEYENIGILKDFARAVEDSVKGEWLQLEARGVCPVTTEHLERVGLNKTGAVMRLCCRIPAHLSKTSDYVLNWCGEFGDKAGIAFQMVDDVVDYEKTSGKVFAHDLQEGLVNFVTQDMMDFNPGLVSAIKASQGISLGGNYPWTQDQLDKSKKNIRYRAKLKCLAAKEILTCIRDELSDEVKESQESIKSFHALCDVLNMIESRQK